MSRARLRSSGALLALVACACSATARGIGTVPAPRASALGDDGCGARAQGRPGAHARRAPLALLLGTTGDSGDPSAAGGALRESSRVAAVVADYPATDLARWATRQPVFKLTEAEAAQFSPIRFVSPGSAPSLIVHGDADTAVPIDQGETMCAALIKAGEPASFIRINGAEHGFAGAAPADLERAYAPMMQWFERHLGSAAK